MKRAFCFSKVILKVMSAFSLSSSVAMANVSWTEISLYEFASSINGKLHMGNVTSNIDASFSDMLDPLDFGMMAFAEHRRDKWSFIGDPFYVSLSADDSTIMGLTTLALDVRVQQTLLEGFVGYRFFEKEGMSAHFGVDILGGVRYHNIQADLGIEASQVGLTVGAPKEHRKDWTDGVIGLRAQYDHENGWGAAGWADVGKGTDSSSYQLAALISYHFQNNIKLFGGYRLYHFEHETGAGRTHFGIDADYTGPLVGVSYRF